MGPVGYKPQKPDYTIQTSSPCYMQKRCYYTHVQNEARLRCPTETNRLARYHTHFENGIGIFCAQLPPFSSRPKQFCHIYTGAWNPISGAQSGELSAYIAGNHIESPKVREFLLGHHQNNASNCTSVLCPRSLQRLRSNPTSAPVESTYSLGSNCDL